MIDNVVCSAIQVVITRDAKINKIIFVDIYLLLPWVHDKSAEEVCPCDIVHAVLFACDCSGNDFSVQVIRKNVK